MNLPKEKLREIGRFHYVNPEELSTFEEYAEWLESILHNPCDVWEEDGEEFLVEIRQLVDRVDGLKIEIYPNEHPPPHFHVVTPNINASFTIESCEKLNGEIDSRNLKKIKYWHKRSKDQLIEVWNETRPFNCVVGKCQSS